ncbi:hypothetical protein [Bradyrhizobium sp. ORS 111]|uniref:hypothetical protein n=1 Tax=Bradyrhizobium sp. ORS 111 TaxID=1685958 RepID=UPI00388E72F8
MADVQRQIDEIKKAYSELYSPRDALTNMQRRLEDVERRLALAQQETLQRRQPSDDPRRDRDQALGWNPALPANAGRRNCTPKQKPGCQLRQAARDRKYELMNAASLLRCSRVFHQQRLGAPLHSVPHRFPSDHQL